MAKVHIISRALQEQSEPFDGTPFYAKENDSGEVTVVMASHYGVFFFNEATGTSYSSYKFYTDNYKFIRAFEPGESLTIAA